MRHLPKSEEIFGGAGRLLHGIRYHGNPPPKSALKRAIKERGIKKLFNTSGVQYKELKMKDKVGSMSEAEALEILSTNGRLVKRPIAFDSDSVTVGFNEDEYRSVWA